MFVIITANISGYLANALRFAYSKSCARFCKSSKIIEKTSDNIFKNTFNNKNSDNNTKTDENIDNKEKNDTADNYELCSESNQTQSNTMELSEEPKVIDDNQEFNENVEDEQEIRIPLTITMSILTSYIIIGATTFYNNESINNWGAIASAYFCFVSLSTIGKQSNLNSHVRANC